MTIVSILAIVLMFAIILFAVTRRLDPIVAVIAFALTVILWIVVDGRLAL